MSNKYIIHQKKLHNLRKTSLNQDQTVIPFDVTSLYANVAVKEAIDESAEKL